MTMFLMNCASSSDSDSNSGGGSECSDIAADATVTNGTVPTENNWLYQLQNAVIADINNTNFDIITIDYSQDGSDDTIYDISTLDNDIIALAYLSIGEAEEYRYYFDSGWVSNGQPNSSAPCWLGQTNPDWEGNYKVQYWSDAWQTIILEYLDKIIDAGFDGVYLDIIDGYEYWSDEDNDDGYSISESVAAFRMINFVKRIAYHARTTRGKTNFYVFPQNGETILDYDSDGSYLQTISGIGIEDLYYDETTAKSASEISERTDYINIIETDGKKVLVADYVDDGSGL